jgi:hypothetical protein
MDEKVIIVKRKKKKDKGKKKRKTKPKATMEQKVSQNVKVIINERSRPRRNKPLAVRGFNTPRLSIQPPTIIHKGIDAEQALNSFRNIYDTRVRALEQGLNGVNGNITNLTSQLQNNRPPPLNEPIPSSNTSVISDEEGQRILDARMAERIEREQQEQYNTLKKDFYNDQEGEQDNIFENFINEPQIDPRLVRVEGAPLAPAVPIETVRVEPIIIKKKKKFTREQREQQRETREMEEEERAQLKQQTKRGKSLEYTTKEINDATDEELYGMILSLGDEDKFFDNLGGIAKGKRTDAKSYVRNVVSKDREARLLRQDQNIRGRKLPQNLFRNI